MLKYPDEWAFVSPYGGLQAQSDWLQLEGSSSPKQG
jgi:hypothetical protein